MSVDAQAATDRLMRFLAVEGVTGKEAAIGRELAAALQESGVPGDAIRLDDANTRIPVPTETGNLIVDLPGRGAMHNQPRIMFVTHMDTVPLCGGSRSRSSPALRSPTKRETALGGGNRCGCGVLVTLAAELAKRNDRGRPVSRAARRSDHGGPGSMDDTLESLQEQIHADWTAVSLPQTSGPTDFRLEQAQAFLDSDAIDCDFVVFALAGTLFAPSALRQFAGTFDEYDDAQAIYSDLDLPSDDGSVWPVAFPAFDYERMLEQGYCAICLRCAVLTPSDHSKGALQTSIACSIRYWTNDRRPTAILSIFPGRWAPCPNSTGQRQMRHWSPLELRICSNRGINRRSCRAPGLYFPRYELQELSTGLHTQSSFQHEIGETCCRAALNSIQPAVKRAQAKILVVDNDLTDPDALRYLAKLDKRVATVLRIPGNSIFLD